MSFRKIILIIVVIMSMIPIARNLILLRSDMKNQAESLLRQSTVFVSQISMIVDMNMSRYDVDLKGMAGTLTIELEDKLANYDTVSSILEHYAKAWNASGVYATFVIDDATGEFVSTVPFYRNDVIKNVRNQKWYKDAAAGSGPYYGTPVFNETTNEMLLPIAYPVFLQNELLGMVGVVISIKNMLDDFANHTPHMEGHIIITGPGGKPWTAMDPSLKNNMLSETEDVNIARESALVTKSMAAIGKKMITGESGHDTFTAPGGAKWWVFYTPTKNKASVAYVYPDAPLIKTRNDTIISTIMVIFFLAVAALAVLMPVDRILSRASKSVDNISTAIDENFKEAGGFKVSDPERGSIILSSLIEKVNEEQNRMPITELRNIFSSLGSTLYTLNEQQEELVAYTEELYSVNQSLDLANVQLRESYQYLILKFQQMAGIYHMETADHLNRVAKNSVLAARWLGRSEHEIEDLELFSKVHDMGKIKVPLEILGKEGPLSSEEFEIMKQHTVWGAELVGTAPWLSIARNICLYHHEKWDGTGYPTGLSGSDIPWEARVVGLFDVYDALRSPRCYKPPLSHEQVMDIILKGDGRTMPSHFDPALLEFIRENHLAVKAIYDEHGEA